MCVSRVILLKYSKRAIYFYETFDHSHHHRKRGMPEFIQLYRSLAPLRSRAFTELYQHYHSTTTVHAPFVLCFSTPHPPPRPPSLSLVTTSTQNKPSLATWVISEYNYRINSCFVSVGSLVSAFAEGRSNAYWASCVPGWGGPDTTVRYNLTKDSATHPPPTDVMHNSKVVSMFSWSWDRLRGSWVSAMEHNGIVMSTTWR